MNSPIATKSQARQLARDFFLDQYPECSAWFDVAWDVFTSQREASQASPSGSSLPGLGITGGTDAQTRNMARAFALIFDAIVEALPTSAEAIHDRLEQRNLQNSKDARVLKRIKESLKKRIASAPDYVIWRGGPNDAVLTPTKEYVDRNRFAREYLPQRGKIDIFIYNGEVTLQAASQSEKNLEDRHTRLLSCFLIYRGQGLESKSLYKVVWRKSELPPGYGQQDIVDNYLSPAVCDLRKIILIPDKKRGARYTCNANISFIIALPLSEEADFAAINLS